MSAIESKHGGANVRFPPPLVFFGCIVVGVLLGWLVRPLDLPLGLAPRLAAGAIAIIAGVALGGWSIGLFRRSGQDPAPWKPTPALIRQGPYRFTRNPMCVGMMEVQIGIGLCTGNLWILLLAPLSLLLVHFIAVQPEERYLANRFGPDYERYKESVRRYL